MVVLKSQAFKQSQGKATFTLLHPEATFKPTCILVFEYFENGLSICNRDLMYWYLASCYFS